MKAKILTTFTLFLLVSILVLSACGTSTNAIQVGAEADGTQVELKVGQQLVITLESNPSTGYGWHVAGLDEGVLTQVGEVEYNASSSDEQLVGSGGTETLTFEVVAAGTTTLTLTYDRIWEDEAPVQTFTLTVVVK